MTFRKRIQNAKFSKILFVNILLLFFGIISVDYVFGKISGIADIRENAQKFRSEATTLLIKTHELVPHLAHEYLDPYRPEGGSLIAEGVPRQFRTDKTGTVSGYETGGRPAHRILFLGGSTTECNEVDEPYRFPAAVAKILTEEGEPTEAINAGVRGNTTLDAINLLLNRPDLGPEDLVVLMENINDRLLLAIQGHYGAVVVPPAATSFAAFNASLLDATARFDEYFEYRSNIVFLIHNFLAERNLNRGWITERTLNQLPLPDEDSQRVYEQNLKIFVAVVRAQGKKPILMTQPLAQASLPQDLFNERVRTAAGRTQTPLIDLDRSFPAEREGDFFDDKIHMNNQGSLLAAKIIAARILTVMRTE